MITLTKELQFTPIINYNSSKAEAWTGS